MSDQPRTPTTDDPETPEDIARNVRLTMPVMGIHPHNQAWINEHVARLVELANERSDTTPTTAEAALRTLIERLDSCRQIERGAGGMTIQAQIERSLLVGVRAVWVEEAREALL